MLRPQNNAFRHAIEIKGPWTIQFGKKERARRIEVPASWNEVFPDKRDYLGPAVYTTRFQASALWKQKKLLLRFDSVNYFSTVWVNGRKLGSHEGGNLPFEFELPKKILKKNNILKVEVDGQLAPDRVPPGNVSYNSKDAFANTAYPAASFDFFPYCGIHRKVYLCAVPEKSITDITVSTDIKGKDGMVRVYLAHNLQNKVSAKMTIHGFGQRIITKIAFKGQCAETIIRIPAARLWSPEAPDLYKLTIEIIKDSRPCDKYSINTGVRTISVKNNRLLLNNKPVFLKGVCRHEDYPETGRGFSPAWAAKDFKLLKWIGANSFRTSHYPYAEEQLDLADKNGVMVIDETPAVGLFFNNPGMEKRGKLCRQYVREMIDRDKNHASVIMWSLANEPHSNRPAAKLFFKKLASLARSMDDTRPITLVSYMGAKEKSFEFLDVVCVNRYYGWYSEQGQLSIALPKLSKDLDLIYKTFRKPVILSEFGADALPGRRTPVNPDMFSEDYQAEMIKGYLQIAASKPYMAGTHVWNMCDFKTGQAIHRPGGMNWKGVFTRDRKPKLAAFLLRKYWK